MCISMYTYTVLCVCAWSDVDPEKPPLPSEDQKAHDQQRRKCHAHLGASDATSSPNE